MAATVKAVSSQEIIDNFWKANLLTTDTASTPSSVLPSNVYAQLVGQRVPKGDVGGRSVTASYEEAVKECEAKVAQIVAECKRNNKKYSDPHFDLDDFSFCLRPLSGASAASSTADTPPPDNTVTYDITQKGTSTGGPIFWGNIQPDQQNPPASNSSFPACAKRVGDIFDDPKFYIDGVGVKDLRQGAEGDCWFIASLGSLCVDEEFPQLIERICPEKARDEKVGVYGFVFSRDGEWISEVIDDKLYLRAPDYEDCDDDRRTVWDQSQFRLEPEARAEAYRKTFQRNSDALHYGSCADPNETWLPLLEKAFAKAHGDFKAINGGWAGEGTEDLTGGITTEIFSADILDKDELWTEGFLKVNKEFLFNTGTRNYDYSGGGGRQGIEDGHAYSVLRAVDYAGNRLLLVKNPWGDTEWSGPWSDGSKEWTPEALKELNYTFGNDGIFWISYQDFLRRYYAMWRTRLFTPDWNVSLRWTTIQVPWSGDYNETKFEFELPKSARTVIVLSQLDSRYFGGLEGQYTFTLEFRLHKSGESLHIVRGFSSGDRSATAEVDLETGTYEVLLQISGNRDSSATKVEDIVKQNWLARREKLLRIGLSYDLAHAKGHVEKRKAEDDKKVTQTEGEAPSVTETNKPDDGEVKANAKDTVPDSNTIAAVVSATAEDEGTNARPMTDGAAPDYGTSDDTAKNDRTIDVDNSSGEDPWNASCVVGLRVFCRETAATIRVVRPADQDVVAAAKTKLDVDDPEKDAAEKKEVNGIEAK